MIATGYAHIELRDGVPWIAGTQIKVAEIAMDQIYEKWDGAEIQDQHPGLTLGQVYSALAYYHDHRDEIERDIEARNHAAEAIQARLGQPASVARIKALKARR